MDAGHTVRTSTCRTETASNMWRPFLSKEERPRLLKGGLVPVISGPSDGGAEGRWEDGLNLGAGAELRLAK